ncbi:hypothetical protein FQR65_LT01370 [Abscondita terminalis]|nr:hypothetical protein FQR65_LT01370 [Abscondita terminalis]
MEALLVFISLAWTCATGWFVGPVWKPFVGSAGALKKYSKKYGGQHIAFHELSKKWKTQILGMKLGGAYLVCVEGIENIKQILTHEEINQRPMNFFVKLRTLGTYKGITCAKWPLWVEQRTFVIRYLSNGIRNKAIDFKVRAEVDSLMVVIDETKEAQISKLLPFSIINILWSLVASNQMESRLLTIMHERTKAFDLSGGILAQYPWMRYIIPERSGYNLIKKFNREIKKNLLTTIDDHHENWSEGNTDDFIYEFISEMKKQNKEETIFTDEQLLLVCLDLFVGGFTTTSDTLSYIFLLMLRHQDVQKKAQDVLDATFSKDQPIDYQDHDKVPYIDAVIKEAQRYCPVAPILGPRGNTKTVYFNGYKIPPNSTIFFNLYPTLMSKEIWGDPETFRPERFLDAHKGQLISYPEFIPFGFGKRKCLGDTFASCIFLFTVEILRTFTILPVDNDNLPTTAPLPGITMSPQPYFAKFVRRHS